MHEQEREHARTLGVAPAPGTYVDPTRLYDHDEILKLASEQGEDLGDGWRKIQIVLQPDERAFALGTTKYWIRAGKNGATVVFWISASSWDCEVIEGNVYRVAKPVSEGGPR
jgi:hypothetical protein